MREIYLSDREHHLRDNAYLELNAFSVYPEDEASRQQALYLIEDEFNDGRPWESATLFTKWLSEYSIYGSAKIDW